MPNWVTNIVTPVNKEDWGKLKELLVNEQDAIDFNKVFPIPQDLQITAGGYEYVNPKSSYTFHTETIKKQEELIVPTLSVIYNDSITQEDYVQCFVETQLKGMKEVFKEVYSIHDVATKGGLENLLNVVKGYFNYRRYGYINWYDMQTDKWGTKWNACETIVTDSTCSMLFQTAWSCPFNVLREISKTVPLIVAYADEDIGHNCNLLEISNGGSVAEMLIDTSDIDNALALALLVQGWDVEEYVSGYTDEDVKEYFLCDTKEHLINKLNERQTEINIILSNVDLVLA